MSWYSCSLLYLGFFSLIGSLEAQSSPPSPAPQSWKETLLIVPDYGRETVLLDSDGKEMLVWKSQQTNAGGARLLKDRALLHVVNRPLQRPFQQAIFGGGLEILDADSKVVWSFWNATSHHATCGDALQLPNGNILTSIVEWKSREEVIRAGRDPALVDLQGMLVPGLMEVRPSGPTGGIPVWKWSLWDHVYQRSNAALPGFSEEAKDGCIDINQGRLKRRNWIKPFELDYNAEEKLVVLTMQNREAWIIDHTTTTEEAATGKGGKKGKGGRLLAKLAYASSKEHASIPTQSAWWQTGGDLAVLRTNSTFVKVSMKDPGKIQVGEHQTARRKQIPFPAPDGKKINVQNARFFSDGSLALTSGFRGQIVRLSENGQILWRYQNPYGVRRFSIGSKDGSTACCGGGEINPDAPATIESAPVSRMQINRTPVLN